MDPNTRQAFLQALQSKGLMGNQTNGPQGMDQGRMMMAGRQLGGTQGGGISAGPAAGMQNAMPDEAMMLEKQLGAIAAALATRLKALTPEAQPQAQPAQPAMA